MVKYEKEVHNITGEVRYIEDSSEPKLIKIENAVKIAESSGLDLCVVSEDTNPPVVKIIDYGKFLYEKTKKEKSQKNKTHAPKEIKFHINIGNHDYGIKLNHIKKFLEKKLKVKITIAFRGREMSHRNIGRELCKKIEADLAEVAKVENEVKFQGRQAFMMLAPAK